MSAQEVQGYTRDDDSVCEGLKLVGITVPVQVIAEWRLELCVKAHKWALNRQAFTEGKPGATLEPMPQFIEDAVCVY